MGNRAKPAALRLVEGNRGHRPIPAEPKIPPNPPKMPRSFKGRKATAWKYYIKITSAIPGWITADNAGLLAAFIIAEITFLRLDDYIEKKNGEARYLEWCQKNNHKHWHILERGKAEKDVNTLGAALGFQPTARGKISAKGQAEAGEEDLD